MPKIPLRLQLVIIYGVTLALAFGVAAVLGYTLFSENLIRDLDDALSLRSTALHRALNVTDEGFDVGTLTARSLQVPVNQFAEPGVFIQVVDERGLIAAASANLQDQRLPVDPSVIADGLAAKQSLVTLPAGAGEELRVLTTPMIHGQRVVGLLQVAGTLHTINATLRNLGLQLALGAGGVWLMALLAGWWILGRALRPVVAISGVAEEIAATGDVGRRISHRGAKDELGTLAETFNRMLDRIERGITAQRQFVADSSHQLGTPLTVIRGNADLLNQALDAADREECVAAIRLEVERMDNVVGELLSLAQLEAQPKLDRGRVRLDMLANSVAGQLRQAAGDRQIEVAAKAVVVMGDADRLAELLRNLLHNAIKYSADGTRIAVHVDERDDRPPVARIIVADQGIGIPAADLARVFERFYRANHKQCSDQRGAGLGLAIVKAIAEAHGGRVVAASSTGEGSTFTVTLPSVPS